VLRAIGCTLFAIVLCVLLGTVPSAAQSPNTAAVTIVVVDQSGAVIPDAAITVVNTMTGAERQAASGGDGSITVTALPVAGSYVIAVSKPGFASEQAADVTLRAGETATVRVRLVASGGQSNVTVYGTAGGVRADAELGVRLDAQRIDETPVLGRKVTALPLQSAAFRPAKGTGDLFINAVYFVTGAGGRRQADFLVDGATADEFWGRQTMFSTLPIGSVQEMNIQSRALSAEFGWTSGTAVNIVTKSGTNLTHGEVLFLARPGSLQPTTFSAANQCPPSVTTCVPPTSGGAATPIIPPDIPDALGQGSFALGGAIVQNRTHYFVSADYTRQDRTAAITSPLSPVPTIVGHYRQLLVDGRLDHKVNERTSVMARVNVDRFSDDNPQDAVSGNVLPNAGREFARRTYTGQVNVTSILTDNMLNEARAVYEHGDPITAFDPLTPSTQFVRTGSAPFTSGESRYAHVYSNQWQFSDTVSWTRGRHFLRMGGSAARSVSGGDGTEFGSAYVLGQFTVNSATTAPLDQLTLADMTRYQQSFNLGAGTYQLTQWLLTGFVQDKFRVNDDLTLDLGLRYDRQTFSDSTKDFAPRVGFGWHPRGDTKTAVRGGYGIYYTELRANNDASFALGGPTGVFTYTATPGQTGFPTCLTCTPVVYDANAAQSTLPARNITIRPGMASYYAQFFDISMLPGYASATFDNPMSQVASVGVERQLGPRTFVSIDYVKQHWTGLDRTVDLNAPSLFVRTAAGQVRTAAAADATRPITPVNGGYRQINVIENLGVADYDGLQTTLRWQGTRAFVSLSYTLSKATNTTEPDGNAAGPNDYNQLGEQERGPSILDQRHRAVITVSYRFPRDITAGLVSQLASARPFNALTGVDNNGDGVNNDRPVINGQVVSRYAFRGTPTYDTALFAEGRVRVAPGTVTLRVEGFNVFNRANVLGRNGTYGNTDTPLSTFGQASPGLANIDPGRMVQFLVRFGF
jgi:hypothetical protein